MRAGRFVGAGLLAAVIALQTGVRADQVNPAATIDPTQHCTVPQYPPAARRAEEQGTVVLNFLIGPDGVARSSEILSSSGFPDLDKAAQDALLQCHFKPGQLDGKPSQQSWAKIRYTWRLDSALPANPVQSVPLPAPVSTPFTLKCAARPSEADFAEQVASVGAGPKIGGTARVVLSPPASPAAMSCADFYHRAQIEALRRAELFDHIEVSEDGRDGVRPRSGTEDYILWVQSELMVGAYRDGPRSAIGNNPQGLAAWAKAVPAMLKAMRDWRESHNNSIGTTLIAGQPYFAFHGKEYLTTADLELAAGAEAAAEVKTLPAGVAIARRAHILVMPEELLIAKAEAQTAMLAATMGKISPQGVDANVIAASQLASRVAAYAVAREWAQAVRQTGLFKSVEISEGDMPDPLSAGYDAVIWNDQAAPFKWKVRDASGTIHDLAPTETARQWTEALRTLLAPPAGERK